MSDVRWCSCGVAANDPDHDGWHKLLGWNRDIFAKAAARRQREFERTLQAHDELRGRRPPVPQQHMDLSGATVRHGYVVPQK